MRVDAHEHAIFLNRDGHRKISQLIEDDAFRQTDDLFLPLFFRGAWEHHLCSFEARGLQRVFFRE